MRCLQTFGATTWWSSPSTGHCPFASSSMMIHHNATILLMMFSWSGHFFRIGSLVMILHDVADPLLELAKMFRYAKYRWRGQHLHFIIQICFLIHDWWHISEQLVIPYLHCSPWSGLSQGIKNKCSLLWKYCNFPMITGVEYIQDIFSIQLWLVLPPTLSSSLPTTSSMVCWSRCRYCILSGHTFSSRQSTRQWLLEALMTREVIVKTHPKMRIIIKSRKKNDVPKPSRDTVC